MSALDPGYEPSKTYIIARIGVLICIWLSVITYSASLIHTEAKLQLPHTLDDLKTLTMELRKVSNDQLIHVLVLYSLVFLFKQTFAIPGALFLNLLAGALFGIISLPLNSFLGATGSSFAYLISKSIGPLVVGTCISKPALKGFQATVSENKQNLMVYMITLRIVPLVPGFIVNIASPFVGVDLYTFWVSTFIGLSPFHYICITAGSELSNLESLSHVLNIWAILKLVVIGTALISFVTFKKQIFRISQELMAYAASKISSNSDCHETV